MRKTAPRCAVIRFLASQPNGEVVSPAGVATGTVRRGSDYVSTAQAFSGLMAAMEADDLIERALNVKRCNRIALTDAGWHFALVNELLPAAVSELETPTDEEPEPESEEQQEEVEEDLTALAAALIAQLAATLEPIVKDPELAKRLARMHEYARSLEATTRRQKEDLEHAGEIILAQRKEIAGLREKKAELECTLEKLVEAPHDREFALRELDRVMRQRPGSDR